MASEINLDNVLLNGMALKNETPYSVNGVELLNYPWNDSPENMDPENNNHKRFENWNMRKVNIKGFFVYSPVLGIVL